MRMIHFHLAARLKKFWVLDCCNSNFLFASPTRTSNRPAGPRSSNWSSSAVDSNLRGSTLRRCLLRSHMRLHPQLTGYTWSPCAHPVNFQSPSGSNTAWSRSSRWHTRTRIRLREVPSSPTACMLSKSWLRHTKKPVQWASVQMLDW